MSTPQDKMQVATIIGKLETQLAQAESKLREKERKLQSEKRNRTVGGCALLIGILLAIFINIFVGGFIALVGLLAWATATTDRNSAQAALQAAEEDIAARRGQLATLRAQLIVM